MQEQSETVSDGWGNVPSAAWIEDHSLWTGLIGYIPLIITAYDIVDCNTKGSDHNENVSVSFSLCSVSAGSL